MRPQWAAGCQPFTAAGIARVRDFVRERAELGWSDGESCSEPGSATGHAVELGDDGFEFRGSPTTPPWYWDSIIAELSVGEIEAARELSASLPSAADA